MKILITGAAGQLGTELSRQLKEGGSVLGEIPAALKDAQVIPVDIQQADLTKLSQVRALFAEYAPDVVLNCAAYTNVDKCETEQDAAFAVNALAPRNLAMACEEIGAKLVHVSTDYVFSGQGDKPFVETGLTDPQSVYGATKRLGEEYVSQFCSRWFVVRTAWLYGLQGKNFVKTIMGAAKKNGSVQVVDDQLGNPTNAEDLAHHLIQLADTEEYGIYHCTGEGTCSWYDFAAAIVQEAKIDAKVSPCSTEEFTKKYPNQAKRPAYSALDNTMLRLTVGNKARPWREALSDYIQKMPEE